MGVASIIPPFENAEGVENEIGVSFRTNRAINSEFKTELRRKPNTKSTYGALVRIVFAYFASLQPPSGH